VQDEHGEYTRLLGASWDVTSEVEAANRLEHQARALQDAERRLERASLSSSEGHWESDLVARRMWFSSSYHALLGYEPGTLPNRRVLAGQLMHAGLEVSLAGNGTDALSLMRQALGDNHPFEAVLIDYQMHDMDGAALGERINSDPQLSRARTIMLTSMDRKGDVHRFAQLGFAGYLTKPVRARELLECLDRVLARDAKQWHLQSQPIVTRGTLVGSETARRFEGAVLVVEDNAVNQKVAVRFLERMGSWWRSLRKSSLLRRTSCARTRHLHPRKRVSQPLSLGERGAQRRVRGELLRNEE